jgi:hypothetical protein
VNGNIVYRPNDNYNGSDQFEYKATDLEGKYDLGTVSVDVAQVNDAPAPVADTATVKEDETVAIAVLENDTDTDQTGGINADPDAEVLSASISETDLLGPEHGTISILNGVITYDSNQDFKRDGHVPVLLLRRGKQDRGDGERDGQSGQRHPTAIEDVVDTDEDTAVTYNVVENDTDVDTLPGLNKTPDSNERFQRDELLYDRSENGSVSYSGGSITYTPNANFTGTQVIVYQMSDGHGGASSSTMTVLVASEDDAPIALDDTMTTREDHPVTINVLDNDSDNDVGDTLRFVRLTGSVSSQIGVFTTNANGSVTFPPSANYNGTFTVGYQISDSTNLTATAGFPSPFGGERRAGGGRRQHVDKRGYAKDDRSFGFHRRCGYCDQRDSIAVSIETGDGPSHGTASVSGTEVTYTAGRQFQRRGPDRLYG